MTKEKGKLFGKINILDLILVLLLLIVLLAAGLFLSKNSANMRNAKTISVTYTVEVKSKESEYFDHIIADEVVTDGITKDEMGKILSFTKTPTVAIAQDDDSLILSTNQSKYDGYIKVETEATLNYPDITIGKNKIKIGSVALLRSESAAIRGYIVDVEYDVEQLRGMK